MFFKFQNQNTIKNPGGFYRPNRNNFFLLKYLKSLIKVHIFRILLNIPRGETNRFVLQSVLPVQPSIQIPLSKIHITDSFLSFEPKLFCQVYPSVLYGVGFFLRGAIFL